MIKSGLVKQKRAQFEQGFPHQINLTPRDEVVRPYVALGDPIVGPKSSFSSPLEYKAITPSPVDYNDIFGKKTSPDERLYMLRQIQQGFDKVQRGIIGRVPPNTTPPAEPDTAPTSTPAPIEPPAMMPPTNEGVVSAMPEMLAETDEEEFFSSPEDLFEQEELAVDVVGPRPTFSPVQEREPDEITGIQFNQSLPFKQAMVENYSLYDSPSALSGAVRNDIETDLFDYILDPGNPLKFDLLGLYMKREDIEIQKILRQAWDHVSKIEEEQLRKKLESETEARRQAYLEKYSAGLANLEGLYNLYIKMPEYEREEAREKYFNDVMYERSLIELYTAEAYDVFGKSIDNFEKSIGVLNLEEIQESAAASEAVKSNGVGPRRTNRLMIKKRALKKKVSRPSKIVNAPATNETLKTFAPSPGIDPRSLAEITRRNTEKNRKRGNVLRDDLIPSPGVDPRSLREIEAKRKQAKVPKKQKRK